ncbi:HPr(Ser) kinase/phosphatase [Hutsoniella sourekii]
MIDYVTVGELVEALNVSFVCGEEHDHRRIYSSEVSRPGLVLAGYDHNYPHERLQLIGSTEMNYIDVHDSDKQEELFDLVITEDTPAVVFSRDITIPTSFLKIAKTKGVPVLTSQSKTSRVLANIANYLEMRLAERMSKHGVFVEVFGMGVLLVGASGVGKSETGLELIQRGHRLIADDRVEFYQIDERTLIGESPDILKNLIEIRGLGIIDVMSLYGVASIRDSKRLELIIDLVLDDGTVEYDRLGYDTAYEQIFDVHVPKISIPVKLGRNLAVIIESAAMNYRATEMGYDAKKKFNDNLRRLIEANREGE